jgi:caffeoyl-CoA O-methyltransferase
MAFVPEEIENYCIQHSSGVSEVARKLMEHTRGNIHGSHMLIGEMEASLIQFLIKLNGAKSIVEFGTYTGFSALIMAEAIPEDGKVITIDVNPETTKMARSYWDQSPHGKKIELILKPGIEAIKELNGQYDFIFIDADKNNYSNYLDWAITHLSPKGFIISDNTLWYGKVLTPGLDKQTDSICAHNEKAKNLEGFVKTLLPIRDGLFLITRN